MGIWVWDQSLVLYHSHGRPWWGEKMLMSSHLLGQGKRAGVAYWVRSRAFWRLEVVQVSRTASGSLYGLAWDMYGPKCTSPHTETQQTFRHGKSRQASSLEGVSGLMPKPVKMHLNIQNSAGKNVVYYCRYLLQWKQRKVCCSEGLFLRMRMRKLRCFKRPQETQGNFWWNSITCKMQILQLGSKKEK